MYPSTDAGRDLLELLTTIRPDGGAWMPAFLDLLRALLGAKSAIAYRPVVRDAAWDLQFVEWVGEHADRHKAHHLAFVRWCAPDAPGFAAYDPYDVKREQRNRALTVAGLCAIEASAQSTHAKLHVALGAAGVDQVRLLVCQGPRLLAWVGAIREKPFYGAEVAALQALAVPLGRRLMAEGGNAPLVSWHEAAVETLLNAMEEPAFVLRKSGAVEYANGAGLTWLCGDVEGRRHEVLADAVAGGASSSPFTVLNLESRGCSGHLLTLSTARSDALADPVACASRVWKLKPRQVRVLEHVATGRTNKEIAVALECAEVTIEKHLTAIFRTSGVCSRAELIARVHRFGKTAGAR